MKNEFPILNYPGSKRNLLEFIDKYTTPHIPENKALFDLFGGSGAVSYFYKDRYTVYANDSEKYSTVILNSLLTFKPSVEMDEIIEKINHYYTINQNRLIDVFDRWAEEEKSLLISRNDEGLEQLYVSFPNVWKDELYIHNEKISIDSLKSLPYFALFTTYYSGSYFGVFQSIEIDSIRYAIHMADFSDEVKNMLLSSLFYGMKEATFSKDGHMAQPLDLSKNTEKLFKKRETSVYQKFIAKIEDFYSFQYVVSERNHKVFQYPFEELLERPELFKNVGFIYADPPYTDMQYSRYFHLLNTLVNYEYPPMSLYRGNLSKGLYTENRYQSPLSQKSQAIGYQMKLFEFCKEQRIGLSFSFAYPKDPQSQQTNRYVLNIFDLIEYGKALFGEKFNYYTQDYTHSNNRNSNSKEVLEYLLLYTP